MRITEELFTDGLVLTGKTQHPTRFQTAEDRSAGLAPERARVDDAFGEPGTGEFAVDVQVLVEDRTFTGELQDRTEVVRVPESALKNVDLATLRYKPARFKGLAIDVGVNRKTGQPRFILTADGLDLRSGKTSAGEAS